jgi:hypothetical protein
MTRDQLNNIAEQISWIVGEKMTYLQAIDFAELVANAEREQILELTDSLGWVDSDAIRARGNK